MYELLPMRRPVAFALVGAPMCIVASAKLNENYQRVLEETLRGAMQPLFRIFDADAIAPSSLVSAPTSVLGAMTSFVQLQRARLHVTLADPARPEGTPLTDAEFKTIIQLCLKQELEPVFVALGLSSDGIPKESDFLVRPSLLHLS